MKLLQGIQLHELILMILGFILGLTLIFIFLYTALKSKPNLKLLYGFIAPLVMIGYPSIQSIQFSNEVVKIDKIIEKVNSDPTNIDAQKELIANLEQLPASRCKSSSDAMTAIANAQASLGLYDSAKVTIQKAVEIEPNSQKALQSQRAITEKWEAKNDIDKRVKLINNYLNVLNTNPNNKPIRDTLEVHLQQLKPHRVLLEKQQVITITNAIAEIGKPEEAMKIPDNALKVDPENKELVKTKEEIAKKKVRKPSTQLKPSQKPSANKDVRRVPNVASPAPVYLDSSYLKINLRTPLTVRKWNPKN